MSDDRFFDRWSRRKRADADRAPPDETGVAEDTTADATSEVSEISVEELAALPRVEDLLPGADIRAFLRRGVPKALRHAALRRMWTTNPAIRDYLDYAREYAQDWNAPGGVPGGGSVTAKDVAAMIGRLSGPLPIGEPVETVENSRAGEGEDMLPEHAAGGAPAEGVTGIAEDGEPTDTHAKPESNPLERAARPAESASEGATFDRGQRPRARHGGATPS